MLYYWQTMGEEPHHMQFWLPNHRVGWRGLDRRTPCNSAAGQGPSDNTDRPPRTKGEGPVAAAPQTQRRSKTLRSRCQQQFLVGQAEARSASYIARLVHRSNQNT